MDLTVKLCGLFNMQKTLVIKSANNNVHLLSPVSEQVGTWGFVWWFYWVCACVSVCWDWEKDLLGRGCYWCYKEPNYKLVFSSTNSSGLGFALFPLFPSFPTKTVIVWVLKSRIRPQFLVLHYLFQHFTDVLPDSPYCYLCREISSQSMKMIGRLNSSKRPL